MHTIVNGSLAANFAIVHGTGLGSEAAERLAIIKQTPHKQKCEQRMKVASSVWVVAARSQARNRSAATLFIDGTTPALVWTICRLPAFERRARRSGFSYCRYIENCRNAC
jgi:hypothetical protein